MKLYEMTSYITTATTYWYAQIDATAFENKATMKTEVDSHLAELQTEHDNYITALNGKRISFMDDFLVPLAAYVGTKYVYTLPDEPTVDLLLTSVKDKFEYWQFDLADHTLLFTLTDISVDPPPIIGQVDKTGTFDTLKSDIQSADNTDQTAMDGFLALVQSAIKEKSILSIMDNTDIDTTEIEVGEYIRTDLEGAEVETTFSYNIRGLDA